MPILGDAAGVLKTFFGMSREEWDDMDHKLPRIAVSVASFLAAAFFWMFFLRHIILF